MIHLIKGKQGGGKTILMVMRAYEAMSRGQTVYSNVALKFKYKKLNYNDIIKCKYENGMVLLDEIHQLLSARNSNSKVNREISDSFLSMVRKKNLDVYGTTQTERKVDIRFREEADFIYHCSKYIWKNNEWSAVPQSIDVSADIPQLIKAEVEETYSGNTITISFIANDYFKLYDKNQIIHVSGLKV